MPYRQLSADEIRVTIARLEARIAERFPESSLRRVAGELNRVAAENVQRVEAIRRPNLLIRAVVLLALVGMVIALAAIPAHVTRFGDVRTVVELVEVVEPTLGACFFLGALLVFLLSIELRIKRGRALTALHELRSLAHIVDMHQLTKDPRGSLPRGSGTASSPERTMTDFELFRYFDYCSEMLSLVSKVAALYVQDLPDPVAVGAVDEIEDLCTGLSRKIWQKIVLLEKAL